MPSAFMSSGISTFMSSGSRSCRLLVRVPPRRDTRDEPNATPRDDLRERSPPQSHSFSRPWTRLGCGGTYTHGSRGRLYGALHDFRDAAGSDLVLSARSSFSQTSATQMNRSLLPSTIEIYSRLARSLGGSALLDRSSLNSPRRSRPCEFAPSALRAASHTSASSP